MADRGEFDVVYAARLARLHLTAEEAELFQRQLDDVLQYAAQLQKVDVSSVAETYEEVVPVAALRKDEAKAGLSAEAALANAPRQARNLFLVPRVLE